MQYQLAQRLKQNEAAKLILALEIIVQLLIHTHIYNCTIFSIFRALPVQHQMKIFKRIITNSVPLKTSKKNVELMQICKKESLILIESRLQFVLWAKKGSKKWQTYMTLVHQYFSVKSTYFEARGHFNNGNKGLKSATFWNHICPQ